MLNIKHFPLFRAIADEICEELFTPTPPHSELALNGVEVFMNASGSHHQLRKLDVRLRAFIGATQTRGGVYIYSNHQGCDGSRLYYGKKKNFSLNRMIFVLFTFVPLHIIKISIRAF